MINSKNIKDFLLYLIVGGIATIAEWVIFHILESALGWHYIIATVIAYIISTYINWLAGRSIVFKKTEKSIIEELISVYVTGIIGLLLNVLIMWGLVDLIHCSAMLSKIAATGMVFIWNFLIRKLVIYK